MDRYRYPFVLALLGAALSLALLTPSPSPAHPDDSFAVLPINEKLHGKSYGEWSVEWWKWAVSIPADHNPILDETGADAHRGQSGPVWFLAGGFGPVERTITVPHGKALFLPLTNSVFWAPEDLTAAAEAAADLGLDPSEMSVEEMISLAVTYSFMGKTSLQCRIDGERVQQPWLYRATSPGFRLRDTTFFDDLGATISKRNLCVSDGYWIMLAPLSRGKHEIRVQAQVDSPIFGDTTQDLTIHLRVK